MSTPSKKPAATSDTADAPPASHPWADHSDRHPIDKALRDLFWRIEDRPERGPALWRHVSGLKATTADAVEITLRNYGFVPAAEQFAELERIWELKEHKLMMEESIALYSVAAHEARRPK